MAQEKVKLFDQLFTECYLILLICSFFDDAVWLRLKPSTVTKTRVQCVQRVKNLHYFSMSLHVKLQL